ncbi:hypothetical protein ES708_19986 [subsurface metagenome]
MRYLHLLSIKKYHLLIISLKEISDLQKLSKKSQTASVLLPVQKSMPGLKDLFQPPENIIRMFFSNYALPLRNIILLLEK